MSRMPREPTRAPRLDAERPVALAAVTRRDAAAAGFADDPVQKRVDNVYASAVSASLVGAPASAGGFVTRFVFEPVAQRTPRTLLAPVRGPPAVLGVCHVARVCDRQRGFRLVACCHARQRGAGHLEAASPRQRRQRRQPSREHRRGSNVREHHLAAGVEAARAREALA